MNIENMAKQQILVMGAHATNDHDEGPQYCAITITVEFLERLAKVRKVINENELSEVRFYDVPDLWGPAGIEEDARLDQAEVVVTGSSFWFSDFAKRSNCYFESELMEFDSLEQLLTDSAPGALVFVSDDLRSLYEEDHGE